MSNEVTLVYVTDEDVIGHIVSYHGNYAKVTYVVNDVKYTVMLASEDFIEMETIEIELEVDD